MSLNISTMHTEATSGSYTFTATEDCMVVGVGANYTSASSYVKVNGTTYTGTFAWSVGGYAINAIFAPAPKGASVTAYFTRYFLLTE